MQNSAIMVTTVRQLHSCQQVTSYPEAEQDASADTPLIAPQGAQQQQQQFMQMQLATGNQVGGFLKNSPPVSCTVSVNHSPRLSFLVFFYFIFVLAISR